MAKIEEVMFYLASYKHSQHLFVAATKKKIIDKNEWMFFYYN